MSIIICPHCSARLKLAEDPPAGKKLRCPKCQEGFQTGPPQAPPAKPKPVLAVAKRAAEREEEEEEDDEEPVPTPKRKKKKKAEAKSGLRTAVILLSSVVAAGIIGFGYLGYVFYQGIYGTGKGISDHNANLKQLPALGVSGPDVTVGSGKIVSLGSWNQNLESAKKEAADKNKDLLVLFHGSDWSQPSKNMRQEVLEQQEFWDYISDKFIPVSLDYPQESANKQNVKDTKQNEALKSKFQIDEGFPYCVLMDSRGQPYFMSSGYDVGSGVREFNAWLEGGLNAKRRRETLLKAIEIASGKDKVVLAAEAFRFLDEMRLLPYYSALLGDWKKLALQYDAQNTDGYLELFVCGGWLTRPEKDDLKALRTRLLEIEDWDKKYKFKDTNLAAKVYSFAALYYSICKEIGSARKMMRRAQEFGAGSPHAAMTVQALQRHLADILSKRSGSGFLVSDGRVIMTNRHVVNGAKKLMVRFPGAADSVEATILAEHPDEDIALLRVTPPKAAKFVPLVIVSSRNVKRGETVGIFGYPLGTSVGSGVKFSIGHVSALPEKETEGMLMLDSRINPGNSGGPLCDQIGAVVGMVTAKTRSNEKVESYGMALPAQVLQDFLVKQVPGYKAGKAEGKPQAWDQIDPLVSPSVVMIVEED